MPESRKRDKRPYTPPPTKKGQKAARFDSPRWLPVVMVTLWIVGLSWIVAWYMVPIQFLEDLGPWNIVIGFTLITGGFLLATRWR